jgi:DNA polymerase-3 subunit delta'
VPPALVTIASRCLEVPFVPFGRATIESLLVAEGATSELAAGVASAAGGRLDRARLLVRDPGFASRQERWRRALDRLTGTGASVAVLVGELLASLEEVVAVQKELHAAEMSAAVAAAKELGERGVPGRQLIEDRHKREQRRVRTEELRAGLASLALACRARLGPEPTARELRLLAQRSAAVDAAAAELVRNPNEALLLEALLLELDDGEG